MAVAGGVPNEPAPGEAQAAALLGQVAESGRVQLTVLTREELAALGSLDACVLQDEVELGWWNGLAPDVRRGVTVTALRGLIARGLLDPHAIRTSDSDDAVEVHAAPHLAFALLGRRQTDAVVAGSEPAERRIGSLRLYRMVGDSDVRPLFLLETVKDSSLHHFRLCNGPGAAAELASWALAQPQEDPGARERVPRLLEVILVGADQPRVARVELSVESDSSIVVEAMQEGSRTRERKTLEEARSWLSSLLNSLP
ncbi:MAG: hypothetical protein J2P45_01950 [Candidatus Dormibacteraeota bacterium]|nr:hypothetical protein [Candidatus Dormibacteraeota bacterium]